MSETIQTKRCSKCKQIKPLPEFYKDCTKTDGLRRSCKSCTKIRQKEYRQSSKGKTYRQSPEYKTSQKHYQRSPKGKIAQKRYSQSEKFKSTQKRYQQTEKGKATQRRGRKKFQGTDKYKAGQKRFYGRHPNRIKAISAINNAIRAGKLPRPDTLQCHYCPKPAQHYHHWHGYEKEHWLDVIPVCIPCHNNLPCFTDSGSAS